MTTEALAPAGQERWQDSVADASSRVLRRARAVARVARPASWVLLAAAAVLWIAGQGLGWWELTVAAVVLTVTLLICAIFLFGRTAYEVGLDLTRTHVVVGERAVGALSLSNTSRRAILPSRVILPVGSGRGVFAVPRLPAGTEHEELFAIPTQKRGILPVGPVSVVRGDPLGLFERVHSRNDPVDLYVHPKTVLFEGQSLGFLRDLEGLPAADLSRDDVSFHALRTYQPGDDLRHVHWKSTARTGDVMVRQYEETRRSHFVIGLSTNGGDYRDADEFELAISAAGSLGLRALRDSQRVDLRVHGRALPSATGKRLLDSLAGVEHSRPRDGGLVELAGVVSATIPLASVVVLVCGSTVRSEQLRLACSRLPYGARVLAVVTETGATPSLRRIGEANVVTVGTLDQLPGALRKVLA
ncbi:MAG TPA: DUF58 domain-containing protein [Microbacterium sp.]|nr:DUF58 domain-containing protein [Microbacterium sp.]